MPGLPQRPALAFDRKAKREIEREIDRRARS